MFLTCVDLADMVAKFRWQWTGKRSLTLLVVVVRAKYSEVRLQCFRSETL